MIKIYFDDKVLLLSETSSDFESETVTQLFTDDSTISDVLQFVTDSDEGACIGIYTAKEVQKLADVAQHFDLVRAAGGLVQTAAGEVLLMFRRGKWDLPKGKVDEGESIEACAVREVAEETGVTHLTLGNHILTTYHTYKERGKKILKESHWFRMRVQDAIALTPQTDEDIEQCLWVPDNELQSYMAGAHASVADVMKTGIAGKRL